MVDAQESSSQSSNQWPPLPEPGLRGDAQGPDIQAYLNRRMNEN